MNTTAKQSKNYKQQYTVSMPPYSTVCICCLLLTLSNTLRLLLKIQPNYWSKSMSMTTAQPKHTP